MVIGSEGRIGKELVKRLNKKKRELSIGEVIEYDTTIKRRSLGTVCKKVDFIYYLESIDRAGSKSAAFPCSYEFASSLLLHLKNWNNPCPIVLKSSEKVKTWNGYLCKEGRTDFIVEEMFFQHGESVNAPIMVYRFEQFDFPDEHMDALMEELMNTIVGKEHRCNYRDSQIEDCEDGRYCYVPIK